MDGFKMRPVTRNMLVKVISHGGRYSGFTLIELLVVVAIISLLVSILLPSLGKAKFLARQVVCQTNLRGIGSAIQLYLTDYNGRYPLLYFAAGTPQRSGSDWGGCGYYLWNYNMAVDYFEASYRTQDGLNILHCPLDTTYTYTTGGGVTITIPRTSYGMNINYSNFLDAGVQSPSSHLLLSEPYCSPTSSGTFLMNPWPGSFNMMHLHTDSGESIGRDMCLMGDYSVVLKEDIGDVTEDPLLWYPQRAN